MATKDSHSVGHAADRRPLSTRLSEAATTIATLPTTLVGRPPIDVDGDWIFEAERAMRDRPHRATWRNRQSDYVERVQVASSGPADDWSVLHQTPSGGLETVAEGVPRQEAYRIARDLMADIQRLPETHRVSA